LLTSGKSRDKRLKTAILLEYWPVAYQTDGYQISIFSPESMQNCLHLIPAKEQGNITKNHEGEFPLQTER
jgi:hypothetical protein